MNGKLIGNLRTITITLLLAILALGPIFAVSRLGPQPANALWNPTALDVVAVPANTAGDPVVKAHIDVSVGPAPLAGPNPGVMWLRVRHGPGAQGSANHANRFACPNAGATLHVDTVPGANLVQAQSCPKGAGGRIEVGLGAFTVDGSGTPTVTTPNLLDISNTGPANPNILIHEYADDNVEAIAFEAGQIDVMDWDIPRASYNSWRSPGGIVTTGQAGLQKFIDIGMFQLDINSKSTRQTSDKALRQSLNLLSNRAILPSLGFVVPICSGVAAGQPASKDCLSIGGSTTNGDFNPTMALQILYEAGYRDSNNNGVLERPGGGGDMVPLVFYIRSDDSVRRQMGEDFANNAQNMPNSFVAKGGGTVTVCPAVCKIPLAVTEAPRSTIAPIVFNACSVGGVAGMGCLDDWDLYTGGWGLAIDPDHLYDLYGSQSAYVGCGGGWDVNAGALNYGCYVDSAYQTIARPMRFGATYDILKAAARAAQDYAWGQDPTTHKPTGTQPTVPWFSRTGYHAYWNTNKGTADGLLGTEWNGYIGQELGGGLGQLGVNMAFTHLYTGSGSSYTSLKGQGVMDWGFKSDIQQLNIVTSEWLWDLLAMQYTYDSCLTRNPVNLQEITPSGLCENFGQTTFLNTQLGRETAVAAFKFRDGVFWSDGQCMTALDYKFSVEYVQANRGFQFALVQPVIRVDVKDADPVNCIGGTAHVYFDNIGALLMQSAGFLPVIAKHVWCNSWPVTTGTDCAYPSATDFGAGLNFATQVGTGPYKLSACSPTNCSETITLVPNPFYHDGKRWWTTGAGNSLGQGISVNPDINGDDHVTQADLDIANLLIQTGAQLNEYDVDYRITAKKSQTFTAPSAFGGATITVAEVGPHMDNTDTYIIKRLLAQGVLLGTAISWPPRANFVDKEMTLNWPDVDKNNKVDVSDLISVLNNEFLHPKDAPIGNLALNDIDWDTDIDIDDLIGTQVREFLKPAGVP